MDVTSIWRSKLQIALLPSTAILDDSKFKSIFSKLNCEETLRVFARFSFRHFELLKVDCFQEGTRCCTYSKRHLKTVLNQFRPKLFQVSFTLDVIGFKVLPLEFQLLSKRVWFLERNAWFYNSLQVVSQDIHHFVI